MNINRVKDFIKRMYFIPTDREIHFNKNELIDGLKVDDRCLKKYYYVDYLNNQQLNYSRFKDIFENVLNKVEINIFIITDNIDEFNMFNMNYGRFKALSLWMTAYCYKLFVNHLINHSMENMLSGLSNNSIMDEMKAMKVYNGLTEDEKRKIDVVINNSRNIKFFHVYNFKLIEELNTVNEQNN